MSIEYILNGLYFFYKVFNWCMTTIKYTYRGIYSIFYIGRFTSLWLFLDIYLALFHYSIWLFFPLFCTYAQHCLYRHLVGHVFLMLWFIVAFKYLYLLAITRQKTYTPFHTCCRLCRSDSDYCILLFLQIFIIIVQQ